jgi:hemerythrin-like domain-containing protein
MTHPYIAHLLKDHKKQRKLAKKLVKSETREDKEKYRAELYDALYPHIMGEDASIFDYLQKQGDEARAGALEAMQEHHVDKVLLKELMDLDVDDEVFIAKAKVLREVNNHHLKEEEEEHFPRLESLASEEELDTLFEAYEHAEHEVED